MKKILLLSLSLFAVNFAFAQKKEKIIDDRLIIWANFMTPLVNQHKDSVIAAVHFPLAGEWAYLMCLNKPSSQCTKEDFINGYNNLFNSAFIEQVKKQNHELISVRKHKEGYLEFQFYIPVSTSVDGHKKQSAIVFRFRKTEGAYKVYVIEVVG